MSTTALTPSKPVAASGPKREVSESAMDYLSIELVSAMLTKGAATAKDNTINNTNNSNSASFENAAYDIEMLGFRVGQRIAEKCALASPLLSLYSSLILQFISNIQKLFINRDYDWPGSKGGLRQRGKGKAFRRPFLSYKNP
jgi:hypothetical protein